MLRRLLVPSLLLAHAWAQASQGPFIACPLHFAVAPNTLGPGATALATNQFYAKRAGFHDLAPAAPFPPTRPDFSMDAMFGPGRPPNFRIDAVSSGYCTVFCNYDAAGDPVLAVTPGAWGALLFSVSRGSSGGSSTAVSAEAGRPDGAGADLFSLVLPGSTLPVALSCVPVGVAQRATDSGEMGFQTLPGQQPEMLDFDPYFSFYETEGPVIPNLVPNPWVYFSVPTPVAAGVASWFSTRNGAAIPAPGDTPSGATILRMQWLSTAMTPHWTQPQVFVTYQELGLVLSDDIDALSVDESGLILLSLRRSATRNAVGEQLMVASFSTAGGTISVPRTVRPYYYDDGTDTKQPMGTLAGGDGGGDVDATCEIDPSNTNGTPAIAFGYVVACRSDLSFPVTMAASAFAAPPVSPGLTSYAISAAGLPVGGLAGLVVGFPGPGGGPLISGVTLALFAPVPAALTHDWSMPFAPFAIGAELDFQWAAIQGSAITLARTVRLRI